MIKLGPSDGLGTCNSPSCQKLGSYTDRVFYLVNRVAKAVQKKYPTTRIGCLAYSEYIAPPTIKIEPNVYVGITTAFNNSKYSTEQLIKEWKKKASMVGIYDYFSWYAWDFDVPGQSQASQPERLAASIRKYHKVGVIGYEGESSIGWISKGLGYYIAAKLMWDIKTDLATIKKDFFEKCFGKAAGTMMQLWTSWENYGFTTVRESSLANWMDLVIQASAIEINPAAQKRFFQIKSYLHYLYLYRIYQNNKNEATMLSLLSYGYRMLEYGSVPGYPAFFELGNRSGIPGMAFGADAKWSKDKSPVSTADMDKVIFSDRQQLAIRQPVKVYEKVTSFTSVPGLDKHKKQIADSAGRNNAFWMTDEWVIQVKKKGKGSYIDFTGDYIGNKTVKRPISIKIFPYVADGNVSGKVPVFAYDYTAREVKEKLDLSKLEAGLYTMIIEDPVKIYRLQFSPELNFSVVMRPYRQLQTTSINYAFIYVPEGITHFNVIKSRTVQFITPTGRPVDLVNDKEEDLQVEVKKGEVGLWRIKLLADKLYVEGIPPYIGLSAAQMLIPAEDK